MKQTENNTEHLASRLFFIITILFVIFIMYASLAPPSGGIEALRRPDTLVFFRIPPIQETLTAQGLRDITVNVLLYLPLGIFLSLAVSSARPRILTPWLALGTGVSLSMEFIQAFIDRFSQIADIVTNSAGFMAGFLIVIIGVRRYGLDASTLIGLDSSIELDRRIRTIAALRFLYICVFFIVALLPFNISISVSRIYSQLLPDSAGDKYIILDPLLHIRNWPKGTTELIFSLLGFLPVSVLTAVRDGFKRSLNILSPVYSCLILAAISEGAQIFILSRTSDITMLPLAIIAGITGWMAAKYWLKLQDVNIQSRYQSLGNHRKLLAMLFICYGILLCLISWAPYQFELHPRAIIKKIATQSNIIPFIGHFALRDLSAAIDLVKAVGAFIPAGMLIAFSFSISRRRISRRKVVFLSGLLCASFDMFLELSQAACIGRYIDTTDVLLAGVGGMAGATLFRLFSENKKENDPSPR